MNLLSFSLGVVQLTKSYVSIINLKSEEELKELEDSINSKESDIERDFLKLDIFFSGEMFKVRDCYLLPILTDLSDSYVYELVDKKIFAHKIIKEDILFWYTIDDKFKKYDIENVSQFNPKNYSNLYSDNLDELIEAFNNNLKKFLI